MRTLLPHFDPFDPLLLFEMCYNNIWPLWSPTHCALTFPTVSWGNHIYIKHRIKVYGSNESERSERIMPKLLIIANDSSWIRSCSMEGNFRVQLVTRWCSPSITDSLVTHVSPGPMMCTCRSSCSVNCSALNISFSITAWQKICFFVSSSLSSSKKNAWAVTDAMPAAGFTLHLGPKHL